MIRIRVLASLIFLFFTLEAQALVFPLPPKGQDIVGEVQYVLSEPGETLEMIGQKHDIGYYEIIEANSDLPLTRLPEGTRVRLPTQFILPKVSREGMVLNLAELRLYFFDNAAGKVYTFPIGIGQEGWNTPITKTYVLEKYKDKSWIAPESIRQARAKMGIDVPKVIPPGPENPLGKYSLRLGIQTYLIHGTNDPSGVGKRSSSGCIRMYAPDIERLYNLSNKGTPVNIINEPYKLGWQGNTLYMQAYLPLLEDRQKWGGDLTPVVEVLMPLENNGVKINWQYAYGVAAETEGVPQAIGNRIN